MDQDNSIGTQLSIPEPANQESLQSANEVDPMAGEQTWPTEEEMAEADEGQEARSQVSYGLMLCS